MRCDIEDMGAPSGMTGTGKHPDVETRGVKLPFSLGSWESFMECKGAGKAGGRKEGPLGWTFWWARRPSGMVSGAQTLGCQEDNTAGGLSYTSGQSTRTWFQRHTFGKTFSAGRAEWKHSASKRIPKALNYLFSKALIINEAPDGFPLL